jgi:hypothetical protein
MPFVLSPKVVDEPLFEKLDRLRGKFRRVVFFRDGCRWLVLTVLALVFVSLLDYRFHLPGLVRAFALITIFIGSILCFRRWVLIPLKPTKDTLALALHIEEYYPNLRDGLSSAVQFIEWNDDDPRSSRTLRQEAINQAKYEADRKDFDTTIETEGLKRWLLSAFGILFGLTALIIFVPNKVLIAAERLAFPFHSYQWPTQTQIQIVTPDPVPQRMARGESLELKLAIHGVIPERVMLSLWLEGASPVDQFYSIPRPEEKTDSVDLTVRIDSTRIPKHFRFRLKAHDAETPWYSVSVLPPPVLVPLDGRPSPLIHLEFPAYTEVLPQDLPDGSSVLEAVTGSQVTIQAATDRPVATAWIAYRADQPRVPIGSFVALLSSSQVVDLPAMVKMCEEVWYPTPVKIDSTGTRLEVTFIPRVAGMYLLRFEDETGLGSGKLFDFRVLPDPAPTVHLDRPSAAKDSLLVVPDATITLHTHSLDRMYALRSMFLEYRTAKSQTPRTIPLYDDDTLSRTLPHLARWMKGILPTPTLDAPRIHLQGTEIATRFSLKRITHPEGKPLQSGDVVILQIAATDFDDVTLFKAPGRSHEIELQIVNPDELDTILQQAQGNLRAEFLQMKELQRDARSKVQDALRQLQRSGQLRQEDIEKLLQAEQEQQQIRSRLDSQEDGIRAQLNRLKQMIQDNHLPRTASTERIQMIGNELERLANEEIEPIEPLIASARKDQKVQAKSGLEKANRHQREVEDTLQALLEKLEPWSGAGEVRSDARLLQGEIKRTIEQNSPLEKLQPGMKRENLTPEQQAEVDRGTDRQERVSERGRQLIEKIQRLANEREAAAQENSNHAQAKENEANQKSQEASKMPAGSPQERSLKQQASAAKSEAEGLRDSANALSREAQALQNSIQPTDCCVGLQLLVGGAGRLLRLEPSGGTGEELKQQLLDAVRQTRQNEFNRATQSQRNAIQNLQKMIESLEERNEENQERLAKKRREADEDLNNLIDEQELLQKKVEEAKQIKDPLKREEELQKLAREQERLERQAKELAQRLSRAQAEPAAQELRRAAGKMEQAREELEQGIAADDTQEDALQRLDEAQRELDETREKQEEQLLREKLAEVSEQIKALRDREQRLIDETQRIHADVSKDKKWTRKKGESFNDLKDLQKGLSEEVRTLIEKKFEEMKVFRRMMHQSADAMESASKKIKQHRDDILDQLDGINEFILELEEKAHQGILAKQQLALKRLDQLLDVLKPDKEMLAQKPPQKNQQDPPMEGNGPAGQQGNGIPPLAELKALRLLQADLVARTEAFDKQHPDRSKLKEEELAELEELQKAQSEIGELIQAMTPPENKID